MKNGWRTRHLGDLCEVVGGGTPPKGNPAYYSGKIPWATVRDMRQEVITETECRITKEAVQSSATNIIPSGNVVIATRVGLGKVCMLDQDTAINQDLRGIIPRDTKSLSVRFLFLWLKSIADRIVAEGTGATVQGVKLPFVKSLQIPICPLPEQKRIVGILDKAFDGIATAKANAEKNLKNARALFESRLQGEAGPKVALGELVEIKTGKLDANAAVEGGKYPFFTCSREAYAIDTYAFDCEAVLLAGNNAVGDFNVKYFVGKFNAYQRTYVLTINEKKHALCRYVYFQLEKSLKKFKSQSVGAGTKFLKLGMIRDLDIPLPSLAEQAQAVAQLDALATETRRLASLYEQKLAALAALKKSFLHQAFAGEL